MDAESSHQNASPQASMPPNCSRVTTARKVQTFKLKNDSLSPL